MRGSVFWATLLGLALAGCAADQPDLAAGGLSADRPHGIKLPEMGVAYLAQCDHSLFSSRPSQSSYTYQLIDNDTLRIEILRDEQLSWIEMPASDYGIDVAERKHLYDEGVRIRRHELSLLDDVRRLRPEARAQGISYEQEAGNWFEYDFTVEVLNETAIVHASLGERLVIPVRSTRTWVGGGRQNEYVAYVDTRTHEVIRTFSLSNIGWPMTCDFTKT